MKHFAVGMLTSACVACGAPPDAAPSRAVAESAIAYGSVPAVIRVQFAPTTTQVLQDAVAWSEDVTGVSLPAFVPGQCEDPNYACARYATPDEYAEFKSRYSDPEHANPLCWAPHETFQILCRDPLALRLEEAATVFRHELGHWLRWSGGHFVTSSINAGLLRSVECQGYTAAELEQVCSRWVCAKFEPTCD